MLRYERMPPERAVFVKLSFAVVPLCFTGSLNYVPTGASLKYVTTSRPFLQFNYRLSP